MATIGMVVLGASDTGRAVGFWARALGHEMREGGAAPAGRRATAGRQVPVEGF